MYKIKKWFDKTNKFDLLGYLLLIICAIIYWIFLYNNLEYLTDSDQASNMIYAKMLLEEGSLFSKNWYFSTYVDLLNMDKFQAIWFLFFNNWKVVHLLTNISVSITFFFSFLYVCKLFGVKNIPWLSFLVMGSLSYSYYFFAVSFNIYALYMLIGLLSFGLLVDFLKKEAFVKSLLLFILVFIGSAGGIRNITTIYVPAMILLFLVLVMQKLDIECKNTPNKNTIIKALIIMFIASLSGLLFNKLVLCGLTGFESTSLSLTRELLNNVVEIFRDLFINGWLLLLGISGKDVISIFCFILLIIIVIWCFKTIIHFKKDFFKTFLVLYFVLSACIVCATFFVSAAFSFESRYLLQSFIFLIVIVGLAIGSLKQRYINYVVYGILFLCVVFRTNIYAKQELVLYNNQEIIEISQILSEENIDSGYASFWNGNVLTELTNGKVESWTFLNEEEFSNGLKNDINDPHEFLYEWLQKKEHFTEFPKNNFYLVIDKSYNSLLNTEEVLKRCIYDGDSRFLLVIEEFDDLLLLFN